MSIKDIFERQRTLFKSGTTRDLSNRVEALEKLLGLTESYEEDIYEALRKDFGKPKLETYGTEIGPLKEDIRYTLKNLDRWARPQKKPGVMVNFPSRSYVVPEPYGNILVIAPWNYPVLLALHPVVGALAAGNTVTIKPSELTPNTSSLLKKALTETYPDGLVEVVEGAVDETQELLSCSFDYIFFTGSPRVGKIVMEAASKNLTPVTLELGGKSPCIVEGSADIEVSARRIVWGKFMNAGQTCVAPDYILAQKSIKKELVEAMKSEILNFYGEDPAQCSDYARIINGDHLNRLKSYLEDGEILFGGNSDEDGNYLEPTLLDVEDLDSRVMQEEIFGPILPIISWENEERIYEIIENRTRPLALYVFTADSSFEHRITDRISFGGGAVNEVITHLGNHHLPFGGVGTSGMGAYHGKFSFDTFSHKKSVMKKSFRFEVPFRYPPYEGKLKWIKKVLK